jgi:hypothetical protein
VSEGKSKRTKEKKKEGKIKGRNKIENSNVLDVPVQY